MDYTLIGGIQRIVVEEWQVCEIMKNRREMRNEFYHFHMMAPFALSSVAASILGRHKIIAGLDKREQI
jgi:hypothetical protein